MSFLTKLKQAKNVSDVAHILGCSPAALTYTIYKNNAKYTTFKIKKKSGGERCITSPDRKLKELQKRLAKGLQECFDEINKGRDTETSAHGFVKGKSILTNAYKHKNKNLVLNIDLENFFDTINFGRVRGYFIYNKGFALTEKVASVIAQIACNENKLPQGSPCSPIISNLIGQILDVKLRSMAKKNKCFYTRYVDDITFSTNQKTFPESIANINDTQVIIGKKLRNEIEKAGFKVNDSKTRMQLRNSRQDVTGLVVNQKVSVRSEMRHLARAMTDSFFKNNTAFISIDGKEENVSIERLNGILSFIYNIRTGVYGANGFKNTSLHDSFERMYACFLFYKNFAANKSTVIICEGETDNIYLKYAFRSLVGCYPELQVIKKGVKKRLDLSIYRQTKTLENLLNITDGTGNNIKFIKTYRQSMRRYASPPKVFPVIVLLDNDSGSSSIDGIINRDFIDTREVCDGFTYVCENLYIVKTPLIDKKKESKIEDFFDSHTLSKTLGSKTFTSENKFDKEQHYGKKKFAEIIVKQNYKEIDFSNFKKIIDLFNDVILHYQEKRNQRFNF
ncbi:RNA-directed DNA polymerase [Salmonella enterica subsp. enterica serovar Gloucester]|nr:RNA-directed DNA polymerase [Salmonella enterica subsp. enterica serovar Gloucester]